MEGRTLPKELFPEKETVLRVVLGPQDDCFPKESIRRFFWYGAVFTEAFDRMGARLRCEEPIRHIGDGNIISDGIAFGSIQVPPNGQPIIMLADRQGIGGYSKIGTVITPDLSRIAQSRPGDRIRFLDMDIRTAQLVYVRELHRFDELEKRWRVA